MRIDGKNRSPKWIADQVPEERTPDTAGFFCRPNDRDTLRFEDGIEGMTLLIAKNIRGSCSTERRIGRLPPALLASISLWVLSVYMK